MDCKKYLAKNFPLFNYTNLTLYAETLTKYPHLRFELGGDLKSCSDERLHQAYFRSEDLIKQIFNSHDEALHLIINDYGMNYLFTCTPAEYLYTLITKFESHSQKDILLGYDNGKRQSFLQHFYKLKWKDIDYKKILEGIANLEQGREPGMSQDIFFINPKANIIFYMYDHRGCLIVSNDADNIRKIFKKRNDWIVEYHRPMIEKYFATPKNKE